MFYKISFILKRISQNFTNKHRKILVNEFYIERFIKNILSCKIKRKIKKKKGGNRKQKKKERKQTLTEQI